MSTAREKFSTQVKSDLLRSVRELAEKEGRQFQVVVEEAFTDVIEKHNLSKLRAHVLPAHRASTVRFADVYKKLAE